MNSTLNIYFLFIIMNYYLKNHLFKLISHDIILLYYNLLLLALKYLLF